MSTNPSARRRRRTLNRSAGVEASGSATLFGQGIHGIAQAACFQRQAAAADAIVELGAKFGQQLDPPIEFLPPGHGEALPIRCRRRAALGQRFEGLADHRERQAQALRHLDDGHAAQDIPAVTTLIAGAAPPLDQTLGVVEMHGRHGDAAARRDFSRREGQIKPFGTRRCDVPSPLTSS